MSDVFESIFSTINAFVYQCRNDENYTMQYMEGRVEALLGYRRDELIDNKVASFVGLIDQDDTDRVFAEVDKAIERKEPWDVFYHLKTKAGDVVPVRERGCAIYEGNELVFLQGLVCQASAEQSLVNNIEQTLSKSTDLNAEIVDLTQHIITSLKALNILSINAGIEAARSGPLGAGFAIVATEIKQLAVQNKTLADKIQSRLAEFQRDRDAA